jgi:hypothetical protein
MSSFYDDFLESYGDYILYDNFINNYGIKHLQISKLIKLTNLFIFLKKLTVITLC